MSLTAEDLAMLTEDERRLLAEDDYEDDDTDADTDADDDPGTDDDQDKDDNADDGADDDADDDTAGDDDDEGEGDDDDDQGDQEPEDKVDPTPAPLFNAELPADIEAKRTEIDGKKAELVEQFDNGEITFAEYNKQVDALNREISKLDRAELKAELAREAQQAQLDNHWQGTLHTFLEDHPEIDLTNKVHHTVFDQLLRQHTAATMEKGGVPGLREIKKAHEQFVKELNIQTDKQPEPKKEAKQDKQEKQPATKQKKQNEVPPTLGKVPAAAAADMDDGRFAHLDRLGPDQFEAAFAKLSEADRNAYLASS